jgi:hypothetical protein
LIIAVQELARDRPLWRTARYPGWGWIWNDRHHSRKERQKMKITLLAASALTMVVSGTAAAQDAMSSNSVTAMTAPMAMSKDRMAKTGKSEKRHSGGTVKAKAATKKSSRSNAGTSSNIIKSWRPSQLNARG